MVVVVRNLVVWVVSTGEPSQGCYLSLSLSSLEHQETSSAPPSLPGWGWGWVVYKFKLADLVQKLHCACIMKIGNVSMSALSAPYRKNLADLGSSSIAVSITRRIVKLPGISTLSLHLLFNGQT